MLPFISSYFSTYYFCRWCPLPIESFTWINSFEEWMENWIDVPHQPQVEAHRQVGVGYQLNRVHHVRPPEQNK
jgi:hypothetical protein